MTDETLVSLQDIRQELEEQELDSWQKLIRVLTHEIMNSVTPVSSLSAAINEMLTDENGRRRQIEKIDPEDIEDMYKYVDEQCTMGCYEDENNSIHGFILLDWIDEGVALLHVCTFTREFDWIKAWNEQVEREVSKIAHQLHVVVSADMTPIVLLAKRIGFKFKKVGNNYKGLKDL